LVSLSLLVRQRTIAIEEVESSFVRLCDNDIRIPEARMRRPGGQNILFVYLRDVNQMVCNILESQRSRLPGKTVVALLKGLIRSRFEMFSFKPPATPHKMGMKMHNSDKTTFASKNVSMNTLNCCCRCNYVLDSWFVVSRSDSHFPTFEHFDFSVCDNTSQEYIM